MIIYLLMNVNKIALIKNNHLYNNNLLIFNIENLFIFNILTINYKYLLIE